MDGILWAAQIQKILNTSLNSILSVNVGRIDEIVLNADLHK